jgi:hypothetical protein
MASKKNKTYNWLIIIAIILPLFLFIFQWNKFENSLNVFKRQQEKDFKSIEEIQSKSLIQFRQLKKKDSTVVIKIDELQKINERYDQLFKFVNNNTNRAESLIDKDLDRLNLYLAIGIGFIGILGVFVPIVVNLMSVQDLRDKLNEIPEKVKIDEALKNATEAIEKAKNLEDLELKISTLSGNYNKAVPIISTLILQNSIGRFFNITPYILTQLSRQNDRTYFIDLLNSIKSGFEYCDRDKDHTFQNNDFLKSTIKDFRIYITSAKFQTTAFNESIVTKFGELSELLRLLVNAGPQDESNINLAIREKIHEIITEFSN